MQINLSELRIVPSLMMMVFAIQTAVDFNAIEMQRASYAMLAMMLLAAMCSFFLIIRQRTISLTDLLTMSFLLIVAVSSLFHGTDFVHWAYICFGVCLLRFFFNFYQDRLTPLVVGLALGFSIAVLAQFYQLVTHPELWFIPEGKEIKGYILGGNYNQMGVRLLITLVLDILCIKISRKFLLILVPCLVACIAIPLMVGSMTAVTSIILFILLCLIPFARLRRIGITALLVSIALFQILVCFTGKGIENNEFMVWFIEDVLGKDITFTYRTHMWDSSLRVIAESPLWGYGYPDPKWYVTQMTSFAVGPHNMLLGTLIFGGIIAFALYIYFLVVSLFRAFSIHDYWADGILTGISVLSLMMLMEVYPIALVFTLFVLAEYYPKLHQQLSPTHEQ